MAARTFRQKKTSLSFHKILMSTLTWITGKELKREIKQRKPISLEEKHENNIAVVRVHVLHVQSCFFFLLIRNKSVLHVQSFFFAN